MNSLGKEGFANVDNGRSDIAVISLCLTAFGLGYAIGKKIISSSIS